MLGCNMNETKQPLIDIVLQISYIILEYVYVYGLIAIISQIVSLWS